MKSVFPKLTLALFLASALACSQAAKKNESYTGLGSESLPAATVAKYAPPSADPATLSRVQSLLDLRGAGSGILSIDGKTLYYTTAVTGTSQVWRMDGPLGFARQMTAGSDRTWIGGLLPNGRDLIVVRDRNGEENPGLFLQSVKGGALRAIFQRKGVQASPAYITDDSRFFYFTANSEDPASYAIHRYDLKEGTSKVVFNQRGTWAVADVRNDKEFLLVNMTGSLWSEYSLWNPETGELKPLLGQGEKEEYDVAFGAKAGTFLVNTPKFGDFRRLYLMENGKFTPVTGDVKKDLSSFRIDRARKRVYLGWNDKGYSTLEVLDGKTLKPVPSPRVKDADHTYLTNVSRDGRFALIAVEMATMPRSIYVKDWQSGSFRLWMEPGTPEVDTSRFAKASLEYYPSRDGVQIPAFVRRPAKCEPAPCPVVIDFHGGPEGQSTPGFSPYAQAFVDAGFVFIEPNVRGSDGYGKAWISSDDGPKRLNVITDIEDAATYARKTFAVNGKAPKVGVMGGSYGGYSTLYAMTRFAGAYDAGVAAVGMSNLITFLNNTAPYRRHLRISEYGDPVKDREALIELSPITHINKVKGPLLIIQGLNDPRVPAGEAVQMQEIMKSKGLESELMIYADEGHGAGKRDNRAGQLAHTISFFQKHLK